jgi:hypothetical protein
LVSQLALPFWSARFADKRPTAPVGT